MQKNYEPGRNIALPTFLPEGFFFFSGELAQGYWKSASREDYYSLTYHRGQDEWIDLQKESRNSTTCPDTPGYQAAEGGTLLALHGGTGEMRWASDGWCYILSGTLAQEELEKIAASIRQVPYREGVMPPYEYQPPAHPLVRSFTLNTSSAAKGLTITLASLQCTPDACTARFSLPDTPLTPSDSPSPVVTFPPANPDLHAIWRVDGGRPLMTMPGGGIMFNTTSVYWKIEPLPEDSRELSVNISRARGIFGPWQISIPLQNNSGIEPTGSHVHGEST
jgi:hypothetical protein